MSREIINRCRKRTGFSRHALAETEPFAVYNSPVTVTVLDQQSSLSFGAVEMRTRLIVAHLTTRQSQTNHHTETDSRWLKQNYKIAFGRI